MKETAKTPKDKHHQHYKFNTTPSKLAKAVLRGGASSRMETRKR